MGWRIVVRKELIRPTLKPATWVYNNIVTYIDEKSSSTLPVQKIISLCFL